MYAVVPQRLSCRRRSLSHCRPMFAGIGNGSPNSVSLKGASFEAPVRDLDCFEASLSPYQAVGRSVSDDLAQNRRTSFLVAKVSAFGTATSSALGAATSPAPGATSSAARSASL